MTEPAASAALPGSYGIAPSGGRLPETTTVGTVRLQVADLARSVDWYGEVLGLRVLDRAGATARLGTHGADAPLVELHERAGVLPVPRRGRLGLFHFAILLPDRAALGRFLTHQVALKTPLGASDHLVSEALYLSDPDGLGIEVYFDRPRSSWRRTGRELTMATLPLDGEGVIAAGSGGRWDGMPAGTTMGHVHLHVGDLTGASRFYHDTLGLDLTVWSYPGALFLSAGGYHHHLGVNTWAGAGAEPAREGEARLLEWELVVPRPADLDAVAGRLAAAGGAPETTDRGLVARDPWGTAVCLKARRNEGVKGTG